MSRLNIAKGSRKHAEQQRHIFDEFCEEHGVEKTRGGSWIVYKGTTARGKSPTWERGHIDYAKASDRQATIRAHDHRTKSPRSRLRPRVTDITVRGGGICDVRQSHSCGIGIHVCLTRTAAREWGRTVYELHIPPSAAVCVPGGSRRNWSRLSDSWTKARASHVRVIGLAKPTRGKKAKQCKP